MKRFGILMVLLASVVLQMQAMDAPGGGTDTPEPLWLKETEVAGSACYKAIMAIYKLGAQAANKLVAAGWNVHYEKYRVACEAIQEKEKQENPDVIRIQCDYYNLMHRAQKRAAQNPVEMLAKTYWRGAMVAVSGATAVAVPMTYMASYEIYRRMKKGDDEDFGEGADERKNSPQAVSAQNLDAQVPDLMSE